MKLKSIYDVESAAAAAAASNEVQRRSVCGRITASGVQPLQRANNDSEDESYNHDVCLLSENIVCPCVSLQGVILCVLVNRVELKHVL